MRAFIQSCLKAFKYRKSLKCQEMRDHELMQLPRSGIHSLAWFPYLNNLEKETKRRNKQTYQVSRDLKSDGRSMATESCLVMLDWCLAHHTYLYEFYWDICFDYGNATSVTFTFTDPDLATRFALEF